MNPPPVRVKICGITNAADARAAIDAGADALGFNLWSGSKRHVHLAEIEPWVAPLAGQALRVAVLVNPTVEEIRYAQRIFDAIQLHGQESPELCASAAGEGVIWKALPVSADPATAPGYAAQAIVVDSAVPGAFGGTGVLIDLERAARFIRDCQAPVWLSGGLAPENVAAAVAMARPYGVDVASGVETPGDPRRKDGARIRAFVAAARGA